MVVLDENFRSVARCSFVGRAIGQSSATPIEDVAAMQNPVQPLKVDPAKPRIEQAVELLVVPPEEEAKADKAEVRREKANSTARRRAPSRGPEQVPLRE